MFRHIPAICGKFVLSTVLVVGLHFSSADAQTEGLGTPLAAQLGVPVRIDPTEGLHATPWESLRAEWSWDSRPAGSTADFDDDEAYRPVFTPDEAGTYVALATFYDVSDTGSTTPLYEVRVDIGTGNLSPVALINTRGFPTGSTPITLDGSASYDVNGDALSYQWTIEDEPWGNLASFSDPTAPITNLRMVADGIYRIGLTVEDAHSATSVMAEYSFTFNSTYGGTTDVYRHFFDRTYTSYSLTSNLFDLGDLDTDPPQNFAIFGFRLDAGSEPFPDTIEFDFDSTAWALSTPTSILDLVEELDLNWNTTTRISPDPTSTDITFIFGAWDEGRSTLTIKDVLGVYLDRQDVIDAGAEFYEGSGAHHMPPVPSTRFEQVPAQVSQPVFVDPYATTDLDGETQDIAWGLTIAPSGSSASLGWHADALTSLSPPDPGDYVITLQSQDWLWEGHDRLLITAGANPDVRPVAVITPVTTATTSAPLVLDGTQSYDLDGDLLSYSWALLSRPAGSTAALTSPLAPRAGIEPDLPGLYIIQLQVSGGGQTSRPTTFPIVVNAPLPVADAGLDQLPDIEGAAEVDSSGSAPGITQRLWRSLRIGEEAALATIDDPEAVVTEVALGRRSTQLHIAVESWPVYHFSGRPTEPGHCDYDIRLPGNVPGANPAEPVSITLTSLGQVWGPLGLSQVWEIANLGEYTRSVTLVDEDTTIYGTYALPGEVTLYVITPDTGTRSLTVEVGGTPEATDWGQNWPYANWSTFACTTPGSNVFQVSVVNASGVNDAGFAPPDAIFVGYTNIRPVVSAPADLTGDVSDPVTLTGSTYSHDANGGGLVYAWALVHRPAGSAATLGSTPIDTIHEGPTAGFTPDVPGLYLVQLVARDSDFFSEPAVIVVDVGGEPPPPPCRQCSVRSAALSPG